MEGVVRMLKVARLETDVHPSQDPSASSRRPQMGRGSWQSAVRNR